MKASSNRKWIGLVVSLIAVLVFAVLLGCIGLINSNNNENSTLITASADGTDLFPQEVDTNIKGYLGWGETNVSCDERVFKETTLWDIKTRISVYANVQRLISDNGTAEETVNDVLLLANEFNIKLTVAGIVYSDTDDNTDPSAPIKGNLKSTPFATFGETGSLLHEGDTFEVTITPLRDSSILTSPSMLGSNAKTVRVKLSQHPVYSQTKGIVVTMGDNPIQNPIYTSTSFRNFTKY